MKSLMACTPLNSISQGSTICLSGFLLLPSRYHYKIHADLKMLDDLRSQWNSFGFHVKGIVEVLFPDSHSRFTLTAALSTFLSCLRVIPMHGFCQSLCAKCISSAATVSWKKNIKGCNFDAGSVATCITSKQKLCCCLAIDINWPFQSLPNTELLSAPCSICIFRHCWKLVHRGHRKKLIRLRNMIKLLIHYVIYIYI